MPHHGAPPASGRVIVMGVSGCGKSTVGALLAQRIGARFFDGDSLHPQANIEKMAAGIPLDDADREPWLRQVGRQLSAGTPESPLVIACSALKRSYRDLIRAEAPGTVFIQLHGSFELLERRMAERPGHFMPAALLESQLDTLEPLQPGEDGAAWDISVPAGEIAARAASWLGNA